MTTSSDSLDLSVFIVSYNTAERTVEAVRSVFEQRGSLALEVIVVDNASKDHTVELLREQVPEARVIAETENHGFAGGNHVAATQARGRYFLMLNPDAKLLEGSLDSILAFAARKPEAGLWGGWTFEEDGRVNPSFAWGRATPWSTWCRALGLARVFQNSALFNPEGVATWTSEVEREVDIVTGCFLLISRDAWRALDGFDRDFFMYAEDADLCLRARAHGYRPSISPAAKVIHVGGESEPDRGAKLVRLYTGKMLLARKHDGAFARWSMGTALAFGARLRWLGGLAKRLLGRPHGEATQRSWSTVLAHKHDWLAGRFGDFARGKSTENRGREGT